MRKTLTATLAGAVIALGLLGGAGVAAADPPPPPSPTPAPPNLIPTWVTPEGQQELTDLVQQAGQAALADPQHAATNVRTVIEDFWP